MGMGYLPSSHIDSGAAQGRSVGASADPKFRQISVAAIIQERWIRLSDVGLVISVQHLRPQIFNPGNFLRLSSIQRALYASCEDGVLRIMDNKVLIVEDEPILLETLEYNLTRQGYQVYTAADGLAALEVARRERPEVIVLDVMLPGLDGFEVCRILRQEMSVPILMLTARADEVDKIVGLEVGADDYLTKPFSMRELLARVKALLRRVRLIREELAAEVDGSDTVEASHGTLTFEDLAIDLTRREVLRQGVLLRLKPKEYELLVFLARNQGIVLSRDLILERVWGWDFAGGTRTVDVHVRWLREKIEPDPAQPTRIVTVRGIGYRFEG
jgi:DNA-binding response OmpR family regulator